LEVDRENKRGGGRRERWRESLSDFDPNREILKENKEINRQMKAAAKLLNIKGHYVGPPEGQQFLYGPVDIEAHHGKDGRFYVLGNFRSFFLGDFGFFFRVGGFFFLWADFFSFLKFLISVSDSRVDFARAFPPCAPSTQAYVLFLFHASLILRKI
jgi:hypothetical protein